MMAIMMYVTSFAQTTEHMKFKGVPMEELFKHLQTN